MSGFVFVENYEFEHPVVVTYPGEAGLIRSEFTVVLRLPDEDELAELYLLNAGEGERAKDFASALAGDRERLAAVIVGWRGIKLEDGGEYHFSPENLQKLLGQRPVRLALGEAASKAFFGPGSHREKN